MAYDVTTPVFEGPFDLLLSLILSEEVELFEVSLSGIVDAYLSEIKKMERLDLDVATEFLLIAATLIELKVRRLLPRPENVDIDEELLRFEERDLLLGRLLECKTFKDAAAELASRISFSARIAPRRVGPEEPFASLAPDPLTFVSLEKLQAAAVRALTLRPTPEVSTHHLAPIRTSVREAIDDVLTKMPESGFVSFRELVLGMEDRIEIIVHFLALLELYKQGAIEMEQPISFGELLVSRSNQIEIDLVSLEEWDEPNIDPDAEADIDLVAMENSEEANL